jgi:hypothetical protein
VSELTTETLESIEAKAKEASRGRWVADTNDDGWYAVRVDGQAISICGDMEEIDGEDIANAEYIVAVQPAIGLAMVNEIRLLHETIKTLDAFTEVCAEIFQRFAPFKELVDYPDELIDRFEQAEGQMTALKARIEAHNAKPELVTSEDV